MHQHKLSHLLLYRGYHLASKSPRPCSYYSGCRTCFSGTGSTVYPCGVACRADDKSFSKSCAIGYGLARRPSERISIDGMRKGSCLRCQNRLLKCTSVSFSPGIGYARILCRARRRYTLACLSCRLVLSSVVSLCVVSVECAR